MRVGDVPRTASGYSKHTCLTQLKVSTIPEVLFSRLYSLSDKSSERFLSALNVLYKNPLTKPLIDILAIQIAKHDDIAIIYGALPQSMHGQYIRNNDELAHRISKQEPADQIWMNRLFDVLKSPKKMPLDGCKKLEFQAHLPDALLTETISHEFSHFVADVIFDNDLLGFRTPEGRAIYEKCRDAHAIKVAQLFDPLLDSEIYSSVNGTHVLGATWNKLKHFAGLLKDDASLSNGEQNREIQKLDALANTLLIPTDGYLDDSAKDQEMFARIFGVLSYSKDFPIAVKLLGEFSEYFEKVVNPSIDEFMRNNQEIVELLRIKPNEQGSYGVPLFTTAFDVNEELYFAVMNDDTLKAEELISIGADPSHMMAVLLKIFNVALRRENYELCKFMLKNAKNLDLTSVDATNKTTLELAEALGGRAYDLMKQYDARVSDASYTEETPGVLCDEMQPNILAGD